MSASSSSSSSAKIVTWRVNGLDVPFSDANGFDGWYGSNYNFSNFPPSKQSELVSAVGTLDYAVINRILRQARLARCGVCIAGVNLVDEKPMVFFPACEGDVEKWEVECALLTASCFEREMPKRVGNMQLAPVKHVNNYAQAKRYVAMSCQTLGMVCWLTVATAWLGLRRIGSSVYSKFVNVKQIVERRNELCEAVQTWWYMRAWYKSLSIVMGLISIMIAVVMVVCVGVLAARKNRRNEKQTRESWLSGLAHDKNLQRDLSDLEQTLRNVAGLLGVTGAALVGWMHALRIFQSCTSSVGMAVNSIRGLLQVASWFGSDVKGVEKDLIQIAKLPKVEEKDKSGLPDESPDPAANMLLNRLQKYRKHAVVVGLVMTVLVLLCLAWIRFQRSKQLKEASYKNASVWRNQISGEWYVAFETEKGVECTLWAAKMDNLPERFVLVLTSMDKDVPEWLREKATKVVTPRYFGSTKTFERKVVRFVRMKDKSWMSYDEDGKNQVKFNAGDIPWFTDATDYQDAWHDMPGLIRSGDSVLFGPQSSDDLAAAVADPFEINDEGNVRVGSWRHQIGESFRGVLLEDVPPPLPPFTQSDVLRFQALVESQRAMQRRVNNAVPPPPVPPMPVRPDMRPTTGDLRPRVASTPVQPVQNGKKSEAEFRCKFCKAQHKRGECPLFKPRCFVRNCTCPLYHAKPKLKLRHEKEGTSRQLNDDVRKARLLHLHVKLQDGSSSRVHCFPMAGKWWAVWHAFVPDNGTINCAPGPLSTMESAWVEQDGKRYEIKNLKRMKRKNGDRWMDLVTFDVPEYSVTHFKIGKAVKAGDVILFPTRDAVTAGKVLSVDAVEMVYDAPSKSGDCSIPILNYKCEVVGFHNIGDLDGDCPNNRGQVLTPELVSEFTGLPLNL